MPKVFALLFLACGGAVIPLAAQTATTVKAYREWQDILNSHKNDPNMQAQQATLSLYVKGIGDGFAWANSLLEATDKKPLFCTPDTLALNSDNYQQILESFLPIFQSRMHWPTKTWKSVDEVPIGFVLLGALIDAFPCTAKP